MVFEKGLHKMDLLEFRNYTDKHDSYNLHNILGIYESKLRKKVDIDGKRVNRSLLITYDAFDAVYQILEHRSEEILKV